MTRFIESVSTHQLLPPYHSEESVVHGFLFDIDPKAIQTYCDTYLNLGDPQQRGFHYRPITEAPFGLLSHTTYPRLCSLDWKTAQSLGVKASEWDHLTQTEFFVAVPVHRFQVTRANLLVDPVIQWVQPFIVTNNATSAFSSREILGLETLYGQIVLQLPRQPRGFTFSVSLPSWKEFAPNSAQAMLPFAYVDRGAPLDAAAGQEALEGKLAKVIATLEAAIPDLASLAEGKFPETLELLILKQFRSAADATQAIYQALVTCENRYSDVANMTLYDPAAVTIDFQNGDMVDEITGTFLGMKSKYRPPPMMVTADGTPLPQGKPKVRTVKARLAFSFTSTIDLMNIKSQFNFRHCTPS
jgi:hypothetical protein